MAIKMTRARLAIATALISISAIIFWNSIFLLRTFDTLHVSSNGIGLQLDIVADTIKLKPFWWIPQYGIQDEFFVHGQVSDNKKRPVNISIVKDGAVQTASCAKYEGNECFFPLRLGTHIEGPFVVTIIDGNDKFMREISFVHRTRFVFPFIDGIVNG